MEGARASSLSIFKSEFTDRIYPKLLGYLTPPVTHATSFVCPHDISLLDHATQSSEAFTCLCISLSLHQLVSTTPSSTEFPPQHPWLPQHNSTCTTLSNLMGRFPPPAINTSLWHHSWSAHFNLPHMRGELMYRLAVVFLLFRVLHHPLSSSSHSHLLT